MRKPLYSFLIACSLLALSCSSPAKSYHKALAQAPFDVIIVPGIPYDGKSWSNNVMKDRVVWSCFLYSRGIARNIIYSGSAVYTPYTEGKIMALHYSILHSCKSCLPEYAQRCFQQQYKSGLHKAYAECKGTVCRSSADHGHAFTVPG